MSPSRRCLFLLLAALSAAGGGHAADAPTAVDRLRGYMAASPHNGGVMYELARALSSSGQPEEAMRWLGDALDQGLDLDFGDPAFAPLRPLPAFQALEARAATVETIARSRVAFRIADKETIPEGIAYDPVRGEYFVGSLFKKKILRVDAQGRVSDFTASGQDGLEDVLGLKVDAERRILWACTAAGPRAGAAAGRSALFRYDLGSGRFVRAYWLDNQDGRHLLNDLALARTGDVFVSDSDGNMVHRLAAGADRLVPFLGLGTFIYPNGLALSADEKTLYVADFRHGLSAVDVASQQSKALPHPGSVSTAGLDGIALDGDGLVGVQNGAGRERIVRYRLASDGQSILGLEVLESRNPFFRIPTTGAIADREFVYIANANLRALDEDGTLRKDAHLEEVVVLGVSLGGDAVQVGAPEPGQPRP
jgi:sugar lactone lactonase YvrE